jgi:hypothetical protein
VTSFKVWRLSKHAAVSAETGSSIEDALDAVFARFIDDSGTIRPVRLALSEDGLLRADDRPIVHLDAEARLAPVLEAMLLGLAVRTASHAAAFHAADVRSGDSAVLLIGGKGSGKSTLAARFAAADEPTGATYAGDEIAFVRFDDGAVESFPKSATLKAGSFELFHESRSWADPIRGPVRYVPAPDRSKPGAAAAVRALVFPRWVAGMTQAIDEPIAPHDAALELVRQSFGGLDRDPRMIDLVARLSSLPSRRITFSDGADAMALVRRLVEARPA